MHPPGTPGTGTHFPFSLENKGRYYYIPITATRCAHELCFRSASKVSSALRPGACSKEVRRLWYCVDCYAETKGLLEWDMVVAMDVGDVTMGPKRIEAEMPDAPAVCRYCWRKRNGYTSAQNRARAKAKVKAAVVEFKRSCECCVLCGEKEPVSLDFHHLDPKAKDGAVARQPSIARVLAEIAKCVVLCANCHRKVHAGLLTVT